MRFLIFAPLLFLIGCASQQMWNLNGQTQYDLDVAHGHCERFAWQFYNQQAMDQAAYSAQYAPGAALGLAFAQGAAIKSIHKDCMAQRGFTPAN